MRSSNMDGPLTIDQVREQRDRAIKDLNIEHERNGGLRDLLRHADVRARAATQKIVEAIGAEGPLDLEEAVDRVLAALLVAQKAPSDPTGETATLDEVRAIAKERGVPGPDVEEHDAGYEGECYCMSCCEYMR